MKKTKIIAAFCGAGKTYICENTEVDAIEIEFWKYKNHGILSMYVNDIKKHFDTVNYIFIATDPTGLKLLHQEGFSITLIYPEIELRNEYLDRYINRDSPHDFIGVFMKYWKPWITELTEQTYCNHIVLKKGEFLRDVL
jgi:hypothetical protein